MKRIVMVLLAAVFCLAVAAQEASAARPRAQVSTLAQESNLNAPDCFSLDIVFLIDQSGSMLENDPLGQRFNAPRYALDWLANNRLSRLGACPDAVHRMGVISFGYEATVDLPLTRIQPDTQLAWNGIQPGLESQITPKNLGGTNPAKAFMLAKQMMEQVEPLGNLPRKRAIVLLTDGEPCITTKCNTDIDFYKSYMSGMVSRVSSDFPFSPAVQERDQAIRQAMTEYGGLDKIPAAERDLLLKNHQVPNEELYSSTYIWVVAMNDKYPYLKDIGSYFETMAVNHDGQLIDLPQNLLEIPKVFNQIMSDLAEIKPTLLGCGNLPVNPYLSGVVLDIYKVAKGLEVEIQFNDKKVKNGEGDGGYFGLDQYSQYGAVEHYRFKKPPAGLWKIVCSDPNGAEVSYMPFLPQIQLVEPVSVLPQYNLNGASFDSQHPFFLKYKIVDQTTADRLTPDPAYPLDMEAAITGPDGGQTITKLSPDDAGLWVSQGPVPVASKGTYHIELTGTAACVADPNAPEHCKTPTVAVVQSTETSYEVGTVALFKIQVSEPGNQSAVPLHGPLVPSWLAPQPLVINVQLLDASGEPITPSDLSIADAGAALTATVTAGGQEVTVPLYPDPTDASRFTGQLDGKAKPGAHVLTVSMAAVYDYKKYRPDANPVTVSFVRQDPLLNNPYFWKALLALMAMALGGLVMNYAHLNTFPLLGSLGFVKPGETPQKNCTVTLGPRRVKVLAADKKNMPPAFRREATNAKSYEFKKIVIENQPGAVVPAGPGRLAGRKAKIKVEIDGNSLPALVDGQSIDRQGWRITYTLGQPTKQRDRFVFWAVVIAGVVVAVIAGIFLL